MNLDSIFKKLNPIQILEVKEYLKIHLTELLSDKAGNSKLINSKVERKKCPNCNSVMAKNGHTKVGIQKYICSSCKETATETTGMVSYCSKKTFSIWKEVVNNLIDGLSIRRIASKLDINKATSFSMRHKILEALEKYVENVVLTGSIETDEKYVRINLKGLKKKDMPRYSKKRGSSGLSGISHHKVCIASAVDEYDNIYLRIVGLGPITNTMVVNAFKDRIKKGSCLISDGKTAYQSFCNEYGFKLSIVKAKTFQNEEFKNLSNINNVHSQLEVWLDNFRSVSIKHLQKYLNWFSYIFMILRRVEANQLEIRMCEDIIVNSHYIKTSDIVKRAFPINLKDAYGEYHYGIYA
jgi:transposase-like protein